MIFQESITLCDNGEKYLLSAVLPALREAGLLSEGQAVCGGCVAGTWWVCQSLLCRRRGNSSLQRAEAGGGHGRILGRRKEDLGKAGEGWRERSSVASWPLGGTLESIRSCGTCDISPLA